MKISRKEKVLVVGAGFAGAVLARELADSNRFHVTVIDRRSHVAGNACDEVCAQTGIRYHKYGPHIFHTNNKGIVDYLSRFTQWTPYKHKVMANVSNLGQVPIPLNLTSINKIYGLTLSGKEDMEAFLDRIRIHNSSPGNALEYLESVYGAELTELFFARYTKKMWDLDLTQMPVSVVARIPVRYDDNPYYFNDKYQLMPTNGYSEMFDRLLDHKNIEVSLGVVFNKAMEAEFLHCFNSMPIDEYFDYVFGELPYRSVVFEHVVKKPFEFEVPTVNFTDQSKYTRVTSWELYPGAGKGLVPKITYEIPCDYMQNNLERYYPVKTIDGEPQRKYEKYRDLAKKLKHVSFIGRCGQYIYYDMHQVVANSLSIANDFLATK